MRSLDRCRPLSTGRLAALVTLLGLAMSFALPGVAQATKCTRKSGVSQPGRPLPHRFGLAPDQPSQVINFGRKRGVREVDLVLKASSRLPRSLKSSQLEIAVPRRFQRAGQNLETSLFMRPTFSEPRFIEGRRSIVFTACLDAHDVPAGSYTGQITMTGPDGLGRADMTITANAKNWRLFVWGLILALLAALLLLVYGAITKDRDDPNNPIDWKEATKATLGSFSFLAQTAVSLVAALVAAIAIYSQDPAWGEDVGPSVIALAGAALAAAGVQSLIATIRGQ